MKSFFHYFTSFFPNSLLPKAVLSFDLAALFYLFTYMIFYKQTCFMYRDQLKYIGYNLNCLVQSNHFDKSFRKMTFAVFLSGK